MNFQKTIFLLLLLIVTISISFIVGTIFGENIFNINIVFPNILVRDAAYGIIQCSKYLGNDISKYQEKIEPPFNYPIIEKYPDSDVAATAQKRLKEIKKKTGNNPVSK